MQLKKLNWQKVASNTLPKCADKPSLWVLAQAESLEPDFSAIEQLFCQPQATPSTSKTTARRADPQEVTFLDQKKSLNINIFLKQFKCSNGAVVDMIRRGDHERLDQDNLKQLVKLLPDSSEVSMVTAFKEEGKPLGNAERFYQLLVALPHYSLRIDVLLLCQEAGSILENLLPRAQLLATSCDDLLSSKRLPRFCMFVLQVGNFLNFGGFMGGAQGFRLSTLTKLKEMRSNRPGLSLIHFLLLEAEKKDPDLLSLPDELTTVAKAASVNMELLVAESGILKSRLDTLAQTIASVDEISQMYTPSIQGFRERSAELQALLALVEARASVLAAYVGEDARRFQLPECLRSVSTFRDEFLSAQKENKARAEQEARAEKRRNMPSSKIAKPLPKDGKAEEKESQCIVDLLLSDIRKGFQLNKSSRKH